MVRRSPRPWCWLCAVVAAAAGSWQVLSGCGEDQGPIPYVGELGADTPLVLDEGVPWIRASVDDGEPQQTLIDTGLPRTLLYSAPFGDLSPGVRSVSLGAFGLRFPAVPVAVLEREPRGRLCAGAVEGGLLGHDLFGQFRLGLDYRGRRVVLQRSGGGDRAVFEGLEDTHDAATVPVEILGGGTLRLAGGISLAAPATRVVAGLVVEGSERNAMVDTGASLSVISRKVFESLGGSDRPLLCCLTVEMVDGSFGVPVSRLRELRLGAVTVTNLPVLVLDRPEFFAALGSEIGLPVQLLLGGSFLRLFAAEIDYPGRALRLQRYGAQPHVDPQEYLLAGFGFCKAAVASDGMVVLDVFDGTDAASKGIERGNLLLAVGGRSVVDLSAEQTRALIRQAGAGATVSLTFKAEGGGPGIEIPVVVEQLLADYE